MSGKDPKLDPVASAVSGRPALIALAVGGTTACLAYLAVFFLTRPENPPWINITSGLINAASATVLGAAVIAIVRLQVIGRRPLVQAASHVGLAIAFSYCWYLIVIILNGIRGGSLMEGFEVNPFNAVGLTWQLFQGLALYTVIAMGAYVLHYREALARLRLALAERSQSASTTDKAATRKVMVRSADALISLDFEDILVVRAAGDRAFIVTRTTTHETRKTLTALSALLPEGRFIRVHRSALVNRDAILEAEPTGDGRLTLHLNAGESVTTSRAGAKAVREAAIL
jgi:DNA-binding LytR/AlgR family response regulator